MKAFLGVTALFGAAVLGLTPAGRAEVPLGSHTINIDAASRLYDISDTYDKDLDGLALHYTLNVDAKGKITGTGHASVTEDVGSLDADLTFAGSVSTAGTATRVRFSLKMVGSGYIEGHYATFRANLNVNLEVDPQALQMVGLASGQISVRVPGFGSRSERLPPDSFSIDLPENMDGTWSVLLNEVHLMTNSNTRLVGTGAIRLSDGDTIPFGVTGNYSPRTDQARFLLKGTPEARGATLNLTTTSSQGAIRVLKLNGKVLGQKLQATAATAASAAVGTMTSQGSSYTSLEAIRLPALVLAPLPPIPGSPSTPQGP